MDKLKYQFEELTRNYQQVENRLRNEEEKRKDCENEIRRLTDVLRQKEDEIREHKRRIQECENEIKSLRGLEKELNEAKATIENLLNQLRELISSITENERGLK